MAWTMPLLSQAFVNFVTCSTAMLWFDDILEYSFSLEEYVGHMNKVTSRIKLYLNPEKSQSTPYCLIWLSAGDVHFPPTLLHHSANSPPTSSVSTIHHEGGCLLGGMEWGCTINPFAVYNNNMNCEWIVRVQCLLCSIGSLKLVVGCLF